MAFTVNQVFQVVNEVSDQVYGKKAIEVIDMQGLISLGNKVMSTNEDRELFMGQLLNRIGATITTNRPYTGALLNIQKTLLEYGSALQKIYVDPFQSSENTSWGLVRGESIDYAGTFNPPNARSYLFENRDAFQFEVSLPDHQINTAFQSAENMGAFISGIYTSMETSINIAVESFTNLCLANFIGEKITYQNGANAKGVHAVNLLELYNQATGLTITPEEAIKDVDFLKFSGREMKLIIKKMTKPSQIYNTHQLVRHTPEANLNLILNTEFVSATVTYLQADTYHKELVQLPNFSETCYWQGLGETGAFADVTRINLTTESGATINQPYVIGVVFDEEAIGVMYNRKNSQALYIGRMEITQKWEKVELGFFNDLSENGVVFYLA